MPKASLSRLGVRPKFVRAGYRGLSGPRMVTSRRYPQYFLHQARARAGTASLQTQGGTAS